MHVRGTLSYHFAPCIGSCAHELFFALREFFVRKLNLMMMCSFVAKRCVMRILLKMVFLANFNVICAYHEMFPFV